MENCHINFIARRIGYFGVQISLGQFISNACQVKISKEKKRGLVLDFDESKHLTIPLRGNKFVTKSNTLKKNRLENLLKVREQIS